VYGKSWDSQDRNGPISRFGTNLIFVASSWYCLVVLPVCYYVDYNRYTAMLDILAHFHPPHSFSSCASCSPTSGISGPIRKSTQLQVRFCEHTIVCPTNFCSDKVLVSAHAYTVRYYRNQFSRLIRRDGLIFYPGIKTSTELSMYQDEKL